MSDIGSWMPWYVGDYLRDTAHLDTHEHGAYLLLLAHAWQHDGAIPLDHERLRKITKLSQDQWVKSETVILEFWQRNGTTYRQKRMDSELRRAKSNYEQRVNAGKSRAYKRALSERSADVERTVSEPPSPSPLPSQSTPEAKAPSPAPAVFDGCGAVPAQHQHQLQPHTAARAKKPRTADGQSKTGETWASYALAYRDRYGVEPVRNAKINGMLSRFVDRVGASESPHIAAYYLGHRQSLYTRARHCVDLLLRDAEALRTEWATNTQVTSTEARMSDETAARGNVFTKLIKEIDDAAE